MPSITGIVAACTAAVFVLTVIHIYAFSIPLNCNLFQYFTLDDYFKLAVQWLVPVSLGMGVGSAVGYAFGVGSKNKIEAGTQIYRRFTAQSMLVWSCLLLAFMIVLRTVLYYMGYWKIDKSQLYFAWKAASVGIWTFAFLLYHMKHRDSVRQPFGVYWLVIAFFVSFMLFGWFDGLSGGERLKETTNEAPKSRITVLESASPLQGQMVFLLEKYAVFLKQNERTVTAIPTKLIRLIEELPESKGNMVR